VVAAIHAKHDGRDEEMPRCRDAAMPRCNRHKSCTKKTSAFQFSEKLGIKKEVFQKELEASRSKLEAQLNAEFAEKEELKAQMAKMEQDQERQLRVAGTGGTSEFGAAVAQSTVSGDNAAMQRCRDAAMPRCRDVVVDEFLQSSRRLFEEAHVGAAGVPVEKRGTRHPLKYCRHVGRDPRIRRRAAIAAIADWPRLQIATIQEALRRCRDAAMPRCNRHVQSCTKKTSAFQFSEGAAVAQSTVSGDNAAMQRCRDAAMPRCRDAAMFVLLQSPRRLFE
jgi:hypothetical protein